MVCGRLKRGLTILALLCVNSKGCLSIGADQSRSVHRKLFGTPPPPPPHSVGYKGSCYNSNVNQATRDSYCKVGYFCARKGYGGRKFGSCNGGLFGWGAGHCCSMIPSVKCAGRVAEQKEVCASNGCGYYDNSLYTGDTNHGSEKSNEVHINVLGAINTATLEKKVFCCKAGADVRQEGNEIVCSGDNDHCCDTAH